MPELITISGLPDAPLGQQATPAKGATQPAQEATKDEGWRPILIGLSVVAAAGVGIYLLNRFSPSKSLYKVKGFKIVGLEDSDDDEESDDDDDDSDSLSTHENVGVIKRCRKKSQTKSRPVAEQKYCLYDRSGKKVLGRHPNRERALSQERLIEMKKHGKKTVL